MTHGAIDELSELVQQYPSDSAALNNLSVAYSYRRDMPKADHAAWAKVEEVAATILFLASPENRVTRGAVVPVYGRT